MLESFFMGAVKGGLDAKLSAVQANADNRIAESALKFKRADTTARNIASAGKGNLDRWAQSVNNNRVLDAGAKNLEVGAINFARQLDASLSAGLSESLAAAEAAGNSAVAAAFSGINGDVVDQVNVSTRLRDSMIRTQTAKNRSTAAWDFQQRQAAYAQQMVRGLDTSYILDNMDATVGYVQPKYSPSWTTGALAGAIPQMAEGFKNYDTLSNTVSTNWAKLKANFNG